MDKIEHRLTELGFSLPHLAQDAANCALVVVDGDFAWVSGAGPFDGDKYVHSGKLGREVSVEEGYVAARHTMLNLLAALKLELGSLDRIARVIKVLGLVNGTPDFDRQPEVINGASDLLVELYGDNGRHARSAVGVAALAEGISVEIEMLVRLRPAEGA